MLLRIGLVILIIVCLLTLVFSFVFKKESVQTLTIGQAKIKVEISDTKEKQTQGLSGRESLGENEGMLFAYDKKDFHEFWMKGMKFSLDFIWISDNKVVDLTENVPVENKPDSELSILKPKQKITKVLEVNAGFVKNNHIKIGTNVIEK